MKVLCICAHGDDEILGCGATMAKHAAQGDDVRVLILCGRGMRSIDQINAAHKAIEAIGGKVAYSSDLPDQKFDTVPILAITQKIETYLGLVQPEIVYTHHAGDLNMDHRITHQAVLTACRPLPGSSVKEIYGFEVLSSTEWGKSFHPTHFVDITGEPFQKKMDALQCYASEMREQPHARSFENVVALSVYRGSTVGVKHGEAFTTIRRIS